MNPGIPDTRRARHVPALRTEGEDDVSAVEVHKTLAEALRQAPDINVLWPSSDKIATALAPTVQRIAYLQAAEEVRTVRQWLLETGRADADTLRQLRDRVDQIAAEEASA